MRASETYPWPMRLAVALIAALALAACGSTHHAKSTKVVDLDQTFDSGPSKLHVVIHGRKHTLEIP